MSSFGSGLVRCVTIALSLALGLSCETASGQTRALLAELPNAPGIPFSQETGAQQATPSEAQGSISGTVVDADGDAVSGAEVSLSSPALLIEHKVIADGEGYFSFTGLPAGTFLLSVTAVGFDADTLPVTLKLNEQMETPDLALRVASANDSVNVSFSRHDIAEEQIHAEEHQRIAGLIPNFYVAYDWNAAPLSVGQKYKLAGRSIIDPANFVVAGIIAGGEQAANGFPGYGQGAAGYAKRYAASLADESVGNVLGGAVFPMLFKQDPRYFFKGTGSVWSRALYAVGTAFICRGDNGRWQPNYSAVFADIASGAVSNIYYPASNRNGALSTVELGLLNAAEDGFSNLLQEFVFNHISTGLRKSGQSGAQVTPQGKLQP